MLFGRPRPRRRRRPSRLTAAAVVATLLVTGALVTADRPGRDQLWPTVDGRRYLPGSPGIGDAYYPEYGNGGYDVDHYELAVRYDPGTDRLDGTAVITATAEADLSRFNLDFSRLDITALAVQGQPARWLMVGGRELVVTPARGLPAGRRFTVEVRYSGVPGATGTLPGSGATDGFLRTPTGAVVVGEPESAASWYPVNDHPRDKASYDIAITVPDGLTAIANGVPVGSTSAGGWTTWRWQERAPMASYLATMAVGRYRVQTGTHDGLPVFSAVAESLPVGPADRAIARTPEVVDFLAGLFGPYPFDALGGVVPDANGLGFALETQTRPVYAPTFFDGDPRSGTVVLAHELAHQWYGDSVSISDWRDIWLNEGFATYAQWLWTEHIGLRSVAASFDEAYESSPAGPVWQPPPGDPGVDRLFGASVYVRGAMTLHALRRQVGDDLFFRILRRWAERKRYGNGTTAEFIALAERESGSPLETLFRAWLYRPARPPRP